jgi:hypothetical protein
MIVRRFKTTSGGTGLETAEGRSGVVRTGDGDVFTWGDADESALLMAELDRPEAAVTLSASDDRAPGHDALVRETERMLYEDTSADERTAIEQTREQVLGVRQSPEDRDAIHTARRLVGDVPAGRDVREHRRLPDTDAGDRERPDELEEMLARDGQLRRMHGRLSESQRPVERRSEAAGLVLKGKWRTPPLHRQPLPALAPQSIATLRGWAASDDPCARARVRRAVNSWPALAEVIGLELMRVLRDDVEGGR